MIILLQNLMNDGDKKYYKKILYLKTMSQKYLPTRSKLALMITFALTFSPIVDHL